MIPIPGMVLHLLYGQLLGDDRAQWYLDRPPLGGQRFRPFLCVTVWKDWSRWAPLTTRDNRYYRRLLLRREWLTGEEGSRWLTEPQYLKDGAMFADGPDDVFLDALGYDAAPRWVSADGVEAVLREMYRQQERALPWDGKYAEEREGAPC